MFYGANVDAILFMGAATGDVLPAPGADTFSEVELLGRIAPPAKELSTAFFNVLNDRNRRSIGGKSLDKVLEGDLVIDWTEPTHQNICADANQQRKRNWRLVYPDANNRTLEFVGFVSKWAEEPFDAGEDAKEHHAAFTITIDGAVTEIQ